MSEENRKFSSKNSQNEIKRRVDQSLRSCAAAPSPDEARKIMTDLLTGTDNLNDLETMRCLLVELCVSIFHSGNELPLPEEPPRQSKLGTVPLPPLSSIIHSGENMNFVYDQESDDSNDEAYSSYQKDVVGQWNEALHQDQNVPITSRDFVNALVGHSSPPVMIPKVQIIESPHSSPYTLPLDSIHSPTHSSTSSLCDSPLAPLSHEQIFHNRYNSGSDSDREVDSLNMGEHFGSHPDGEDEESVVTVNATHDQGHHSSQSKYRNSPNTIRQALSGPETPPTTTKQWVKDHGKLKPKSSKRVFRVHGPTRLRNIIEHSVEQVLQQYQFENSSTPQKNQLSSKQGMEDFKQAIFTVPILKRITRSVSIDVSLEISSNPQLPTDGPKGLPPPSPAARDLSTILWPAISNFVGTDVSEEMIGVFVDLIEADIIEKKLFPDLYVQQLQVGSEEEIDETEQNESYGLKLSFDDGESGDELTGSGQIGVVKDYMSDLESRKETNKHSKGKSKLNQSSPVRQILDLHDDFDEEDSDYYPRFGDHRGIPSTKSSNAWDVPKSPMDEIFRKTVGTIGSDRKLPYIPDEDMNDSSTYQSEIEDDDRLINPYQCFDQLEVYRGIDDSDYDSDGLQLHKDTEYVDTLEQAQSLKYPQRFPNDDSEYSGSEVGDTSPPPEDNLETTHDDEDFISVSDLPIDFGLSEFDIQLTSQNRFADGIYHTEAPLDESEVEKLEQQMESLNTSQSSRLFSQPSIAEIMVGEADNLIVLPRGESPVSSPDPRIRGGNCHPIFDKEDVGSPKYMNHIPSTSSDSGSDNEEDSRNSHPDESEDEQDSLEGKIASNGVIQNIQNDQIQIDTLLSEDTDEMIMNRQNWMYTNKNHHIPPSPFITDDGFKSQIPFPKSLNGLSPSSTIDFQAIAEDRSGEELEECEEDQQELWSQNDDSDDQIEPRSVDPLFLVPSPQRHHYSPKGSKSVLNQSDSSSESSNDLDPSPPMYPQTMTSDDEREEDRRLFEDVMTDRGDISQSISQQKNYLSAEFPEPTDEEMREYYTEMMRGSLNGFKVATDLTEKSVEIANSTTKLHEISAQALQKMDKQFHQLLHHSGDLGSSLSAEQQILNMENELNSYHQRKSKSKKNSKNSHKSDQFESTGLAVSAQDVLSPDEYHQSSAKTNEVAYSQRLQDIMSNPSRDIPSLTLPITGNEELNKMFTKSFRELMSYYQPSESQLEEEIEIAEPTRLEDGVKPKKQKKKKSNLHREIELNLEEEVEQRNITSVKKSRSVKQYDPHELHEQPDTFSSTRKQRSLDLSSQTIDIIPSAVDSSKHIHGNTSTLSSEGRVVYGNHNVGPVMTQEWNQYQNRSINTLSRSASNSLSSPGKGNIKTAHVIPSALPKEKSKSKKIESEFNTNTTEQRREKEREKPSSTGSHSNRSLKKNLNAEKRFQRLTAPTFSSTARTLDIAGIDLNDVQAITQASKDAANYVSSTYDPYTPHNQQLSYVDSYYSTGIDIISSLAANHSQSQSHSSSSKKKKSKK